MTDQCRHRRALGHVTSVAITSCLTSFMMRPSDDGCLLHAPKGDQARQNTPYINWQVGSPGSSKACLCPHFPLSSFLSSTYPSFEVRLAFLNPNLAASIQGENTVSIARPKSKFSARFLVALSLFLQDANLLILHPPSCCLPSLAPTLSPLPGTRGVKGPHGIWCLSHPPTPKQEEPNRLRGLLSHLTLFHFFFL